MLSVTSLRESAKEVKNVSSISGTAMLMAIKTVIAQFTIKVSNFLEIGFSSCITGICGYFYGPWLSGLAGFVVDHIEFLLRPSGPYFPGFAINEFVSGFFFGLFFYKKELTWKRVLLAHSVVTLCTNLFLTPLWLSILYGNTFWALWIGRLAVQCVRFPIDFAILFSLLKIAERIRPNIKK